MEKAKRTKLIIIFTRANIEIRSENGKINMGIPYCFDTKFGEENIKRLLNILGFDVEIKNFLDQWPKHEHVTWRR